MKHTPHTHAFSLIELVVVLAIISTLGMMALPRYGFALERYRATAAHDRVQADIKRTQRRARATGVNWTIEFDSPGTSYRVYQGRFGDVIPVSSLETVSIEHQPYNAQIVLADISGATHVTFDMYGQADGVGEIHISSGRLDSVIPIGQ